MKSRLSLGIAGSLLLLFFLLIKAPAILLPRLVPEDQVTLQGLSGTLWSGSASRALVATPVGHLHLGRVQWTLNPWSLLWLAPELDIDSEWGGQYARGTVSLRGGDSLSLENFELAAPADLVRRFAPVALSGHLSVQLRELEIRDGLPQQGAGRLVWQDAGWQAPQGQMALGAYALDFVQADGEPLLGDVISLAGPVRAEGTLTLVQRNYAVDITIGGDGKLDQQLQQALSLLAEPEGEEWRLRLDGEF